MGVRLSAQARQARQGALIVKVESARWQDMGMDSEGSVVGFNNER